MANQYLTEDLSNYKIEKFCRPNETIYEGQVVGEHSRANDLSSKIIQRPKGLTNMSAGANDKVKIAPALQFTLEEALEIYSSR